VTEPTLEENVERLLRRCVPRVPAEQVERSLARAERRRASPARHRALPLAAAAAAALAIAGWLALSPRPDPKGPAAAAERAQDPPTPESLQEIEKLIGELGSPAGAERLKAEGRLREIGKPALEPLDKALYHENPDVRVAARDLARLIRKDLEGQAEVARARAAAEPVRAAVKKVRERWAARDFKSLEQAVRDAFAPMRVSTAHYVPKKEIGPEFRLAGVRYVPEKKTGATFRPEGQEPQPSDVLTRELMEALDKEGGIVFLDMEGRVPVIAEFAWTFLFTLPDRQGWSAYVFVEAGPQVVLKSRLLASADTRQVWGLDPEALRDATAFVRKLLTEGVQTAEGDPEGLKVKTVPSGSFAAGLGLQEGDVIQDVNGQPVRKLADIPGVAAPSALSGVRLVLLRSGKPFVLEYRPLPR
jgi:hypothetical protein